MTCASSRKPEHIDHLVPARKQGTAQPHNSKAPASAGNLAVCACLAAFSCCFVPFRSLMRFFACFIGDATLHTSPKASIGPHTPCHGFALWHSGICRIGRYRLLCFLPGSCLTICNTVAEPLAPLRRPMAHARLNSGRPRRGKRNEVQPFAARTVCDLGLLHNSMATIVPPCKHGDVLFPAFAICRGALHQVFLPTLAQAMRRG